MRLRHSAGAEANVQYFRTPPPDEGPDWHELKPKPFRRFDAAVRKLAGPTETFTELTLDLNDWFALAKPGAYRLQLIFDRRAGAFTEGRSLEVQFSLAPKQALTAHQKMP